MQSLRLSCHRHESPSERVLRLRADSGSGPACSTFTGSVECLMRDLILQADRPVPILHATEDEPQYYEL